MTGWGSSEFSVGMVAWEGVDGGHGRQLGVVVQHFAADDSVAIYQRRGENVREDDWDFAEWKSTIAVQIDLHFGRFDPQGTSLQIRANSQRSHEHKQNTHPPNSRRFHLSKVSSLQYRVIFIECDLN